MRECDKVVLVVALRHGHVGGGANQRGVAVDDIISSTPARQSGTGIISSHSTFDLHTPQHSCYSRYTRCCFVASPLATSPTGSLASVQGTSHSRLSIIFARAQP